MTTNPNEPLPEPEIVPPGDPGGPEPIPTEPQPPSTEPDPLP
ncbi:hypothetical protein [Nocardioides hwasunensis]|nr:hypothetical protein [Nocardioides hwasunensis]